MFRLIIHLSRVQVPHWGTVWVAAPQGCLGDLLKVIAFLFLLNQGKNTCSFRKILLEITVLPLLFNAKENVQPTEEREPLFPSFRGNTLIRFGLKFISRKTANIIGEFLITINQNTLLSFQPPQEQWKGLFKTLFT